MSTPPVAKSRNVRVTAKIRAYTGAGSELAKGNFTLPPWNYGAGSSSAKKTQSKSTSRQPLTEMKPNNGSKSTSRLPLSEKKSKCPGSEARRLFHDANQMNTMLQVNSLSKSLVKLSKPKPPMEEESVSGPSKTVTLKEEVLPESLSTKDTESSDVLEKKESVSGLSRSITCIEEEVLQSLDVQHTNCSDITKQVISTYTEKDHIQSSNVANNLSEVATNIIEEGLILMGNKTLSLSQEISPPISARLQELSSNMKLFSQEKLSHLKSALPSTPSCITIPQASPLCITVPEASPLCITVPRASPPCMAIPQASTDMTPRASTDIIEPKTPVPGQNLRLGVSKITSPQSSFKMPSLGVKESIVKEHLKFLNSANKEELKRLKGIGEKRAAYIVRLREGSPEYFKELDDLKDIGLSVKQIEGMMVSAVGDLFS